jgi:exopolysaccharide biosynthesis predicted pyruvyltransferase EpsI
MAQMQNNQLIQRLRRNLVETFEPVIGGQGPFVLLDYPDAVNAGDHAIWLGEKALLKHLGIEIAHQCSMQGYDKVAVAKALGAGTILMHGGGNFGDIYVYHQFRHQVLRDFPDNRVVVFPQTVMFFSDANLIKSALIFSVHGNITIAARDVLSFQTLQKFFGARSSIILAPDAAFMIGAPSRPTPPRFEVVWLSRTDAEGIAGASVADTVELPELCADNVELGTFADGIGTVARADVAGTKLLVTDWYRCAIPSRSDLDQYNRLDLDRRSQFWVDRALRILSAGHVVVSDRLHAHILCALAGIPHVLLNNNYGKNFSFFESWCRPLDICRLARSPSDAWALAQQMLRERE